MVTVMYRYYPLHNPPFPLQIFAESLGGFRKLIKAFPCWIDERYFCFLKVEIVNIYSRRQNQLIIMFGCFSEFLFSQTTKHTSSCCCRSGNTAEISLSMFFRLRIKSKTSIPFFLIFELLRSCLLSKSLPAEVEKCGLINKRWMRGETTLSDEHHFTFKDRKQT